MSKIKLYLCEHCKSPMIRVFSNFILLEGSLSSCGKGFINSQCYSCNVKTSSPLMHDILHIKNYPQTIKAINEIFINKVKDQLVTVKTFPTQMRLQFCSIKIKQGWYQKGNSIYAFCKDEMGTLCRFAGESALKIVYNAIKDKYFAAKITVSKHWAPNKVSKYDYKNTKFSSLVQVPRILGDIERL